MSFLYDKEIEIISTAMKEAADILKQPFDIEEKAARDVVTTNDLAIEALLCDRIQSHFKNDVIMSEESHKTYNDAERVWIIDPIDGTTNYSRGIPLYGIQVAFAVDGYVMFSVIFIVPSDEFYVAKRGMGAWCNGEAISVSTAGGIDEAIVSLGDFSTTNEMRNTRILSLIRSLMDKAYKLKLHGTACVDLAFIASGKTDVHVMSANHLWDYLPGLLLVHEAGGVVDVSLLGPIGGKKTLMVIASTGVLADYVNDLL